jgi:hypothetical protein
MNITITKLAEWYSLDELEVKKEKKQKVRTDDEFLSHLITSF